MSCLIPTCKNKAEWISVEGATWCDEHVPRSSSGGRIWGVFYRIQRKPVEKVDEIVAVAFKEIDSLILYVKSLTASKGFLDLEKEKKVMVKWLVNIKQMYEKAIK